MGENCSIFDDSHGSAQKKSGFPRNQYFSGPLQIMYAPSRPTSTDLGVRIGGQAVPSGILAYQDGVFVDQRNQFGFEFVSAV